MATKLSILVFVGLQAEVLLQHDGKETMTCTCFMFLKPTNKAHKLIMLWSQSIVDMRSTKNQVSTRTT